MATGDQYSKREHLDVINAKAIADKGLTMAIEYSGNNPIYVGEAAPGTPKSSSAWRIKKITWSGSNPTDIQWADGTAEFTKEWDERSNYTYS